MSYRDRLPQLSSGLFITDGGLETTLIFHEGVDLPCFASFQLLADEAGTAMLRAYFAPYTAIAREYGVGLVLDSPLRRCAGGFGASTSSAAVAAPTAAMSARSAGPGSLRPERGSGACRAVG